MEIILLHWSPQWQSTPLSNYLHSLADHGCWGWSSCCALSGDHVSGSVTSTNWCLKLFVTWRIKTYRDKFIWSGSKASVIIGWFMKSWRQYLPAAFVKHRFMAVTLSKLCYRFPDRMQGVCEACLSLLHPLSTTARRVPRIHWRDFCGVTKPNDDSYTEGKLVVQSVGFVTKKSASPTNSRVVGVLLLLFCCFHQMFVQWLCWLGIHGYGEEYNGQSIRLQHGDDARTKQCAGFQPGRW